MDKEFNSTKKKSIWDSFTYVFAGFIIVSCAVITILAYLRGCDIVSIIFSFIAGFVLAETLSLDRTKDWG